MKPALFFAALALAGLLTGCNLSPPSAPDWPTPTPEILEEPTVPLDDQFEIIVPQSREQTGPDGATLPTPASSPDLSLPPTAIAPAPEDADAALFPDTYPDVAEVQLRAGQTLIVNYDIQINNPDRGRVFIIVRDPTGAIIWRAMFSETVRASAEVPAETGGMYQVAAAIQNLSGSYQMSFDIR